MKISEKKILGIELVMIFLLILNIFWFKMSNSYVLALILFSIFGFSVLLLGYEKDRHRFKKDGLLMILIYALAYQFIIYLSGLFLGFVNNGYSLSFINIIKNITPVLLMILATELLRYELVGKGEKKKGLIVLSVILFVLLDITIVLHLYNFHDYQDLIELIAVTIIPSIAKNILFTYWVLRFGYLANIIYRLIMELPIYLIPIIPNFNIYLEAVITFIYPIILFVITKKTLKEEEEEDKRKRHLGRKIISMIVILFLLVIVLLTSGVFKYYFLSIGSGSMSPNINKGDVVIVKKVNEEELKEIQTGDVLVFKQDDRVVVHRVYEVRSENNIYSFVTKGDNNDEVDHWVIGEDSVIGVATIRIPVVGYPTIWLNELIGGIS